MKKIFNLNILLISLLIVSCNSIATFNFKIIEEQSPSRYDSECICYIAGSPGYDQDFDFIINKIEIVENAVLTYWEHVLVINFEVLNNKDERKLLPEIGIVLLNEEETQFEPNYFDYPYVSGTFNPRLSYFQMNTETYTLPIGSLASKEKLKFKSTITLYQNSNEKFEGLYFLHFLRIPAVNANHRDTHLSEIPFIKENSVFSLSLNMNSIYTF